ncbi:MAG: EF2563 family selenium-dependent molybdenum hydroxylase system protein [Planctomycetes bacterium]|nr:EF2563 family selenium-dependent molybdenum hydroxylase system protein [Planctomycetota bacterium]
MFDACRVLIRGAGEHASGTAHRLFACGFRVVMTDLAQPEAIRRTVAFAAALPDGAVEVAGVRAVGYGPPTPAAVRGLDGAHVAVFVDPEATVAALLRPEVLIDARMLKRDPDTTLADAPFVIGFGPGFRAGRDAHCVIETQRGHDLGAILYEGAAAPDTGTPAEIRGYSAERCARAPADGVFASERTIGDTVSTGDLLGAVAGLPVRAGVAGVLRGLLRPGTAVRRGQKLADIDPRGDRAACFTLSDKTRTISGGALEAILVHLGRRRP